MSESHVGDCDRCGTEQVMVKQYRSDERLCDVCATLIGRDASVINLAICTNIILKAIAAAAPPPQRTP